VICLPPGEEVCPARLQITQRLRYEPQDWDKGHSLTSKNKTVSQNHLIIRFAHVWRRWWCKVQCPSSFLVSLIVLIGSRVGVIVVMLLTPPPSLPYTAPNLRQTARFAWTEQSRETQDLCHNKYEYFNLYWLCNAQV
jgi:hypothetical protein